MRHPIAHHARRGFTLIELMIVIAIIAIIAAIAIPNLIESKTTAQEAAASAALKSGVLPAQVQFQAGGYSDADGNGVGAYCVSGASACATPYSSLCGQAVVGTVTLNLLPPSYAGSAPVVGSYLFKTPVTGTAPTLAGTVSDGSAERTWGVICYPSDDNSGRRFFGINQAGNVFQSRPCVTASSNATIGMGGAATTAIDMFGAQLVSAPSGAMYLPRR